MTFFNKIIIACFALLITSSSSHAKNKRAAIVFDESTEQVLHAEHADEVRHPASLTKKMTFYIVFQALKSGRLTLDMELPVSQYAANQEPCKIHLQPGQRVAVIDLVKAMVTKSANDASCVLAEELGGSVAGFVRMMNATARKLGMNKTVFYNPTGLPHPHQVTTAREMLILARALLKDFPEYYPLFKTINFTYNGKTYRNHNRMLGVVEGMEGLKTGFVNASGFNISTSTKRGDRRIFTIVMGGKSWQERNRKAEHLIETAFANSSNFQCPLEASDPIQRKDEPLVQYLKGIDAQTDLQKALEISPKPRTKRVSKMSKTSKPSFVKTVLHHATPKKFKKCAKRKNA